MEEKKKYFLFADECGDPGLSKYDPSFAIFTLCGVIVSREQIRSLESQMRALKIKIWGDDTVIFHSHEIRRQKNVFEIFQDEAVKEQFYTELDSILGTTGAYIIVSSSVLKDDYARKYGKLGDVYSHALTFLLERAIFYIDDVNPGVGGTIDAILERRGKVEDKKLSESYNELREKGTYWVTPERMKDRMNKLEFVPKAANIIGLQIADLIAYPIACHLLWPDKENPAYDIIKGNIYISDGKELGVKVIK